MSYFHVILHDLTRPEPCHWIGTNYASIDDAKSGATADWPVHNNCTYYVIETTTPKTSNGFGGENVQSHGCFVLASGKLVRLSEAARTAVEATTAKVYDLAAEAHKGQTRKYTGEPYVTHCFAVQKLVSEQLDVLGITDPLFRIVWEHPAVLHDVLEDTTVTAEQIVEVLGRWPGGGKSVASYVDTLTNKFTAKTHPALNRAARKKLERGRYQNENIVTKTIKLADVCHNLEGLHLLDPDFYKTYAAEAELLIDVLHVTAENSPSGGGGILPRNNNYLYEKAQAILKAQKV